MDKGRKKPKIICFANLKGGSSKTTMCFNSAGILAERGLNVLLCDVDAQSNLTQCVGIDITEKDAITIKDIFEQPASAQPAPQDVIVKSPIPELKTLDILPSSIFLFKTDRLISTYSSNELILTRYFKKHADYFSRYDIIIIDVCPSMNLMNVNTFLLADNIVLCCDVSKASFVGAQLFCALLDEIRVNYDKEDNVAAISIQNYDGRSNLAKDFLEQLRNDDFSKDIILDTVIPQTSKIKNCELKMLPVNIMYPKAKITAIFEQLVDELFRKGIL